jgi:hypothetical protein
MHFVFAGGTNINLDLVRHVYRTESRALRVVFGRDYFNDIPEGPEADRLERYMQHLDHLRGSGVPDKNQTQ